MHQVVVNWRPRFLPLVELLLLSPSSLLLSFFLRTNATFLPSVICTADSPSGPWRTPPQQPVHSRRRPVYTVLIGSALDCPCDLPPLFPYAHALSLFSLCLFHNPQSPQTPATPPYGLYALTAHPSVAVWSATVGQGMLCRSPGSKDVNQS